MRRPYPNILAIRFWAWVEVLAQRQRIKALRAPVFRRGHLPAWSAAEKFVQNRIKTLEEIR